MMAPNWFQSVTELEHVDSTNSYVQRELLKNGSDIRLPWLVNALHQTAGRGRSAKTWLSDENSLTFSIAWSCDTVEPNQLSQLPLYVGMAISDSLRPLLQVAPQVKWPNDVMIAGRKTAGILIESFKATLKPNESPTLVFVIGIGINCDVDLNTLDPVVSQRATSVRAHLKPEINVNNAELRKSVFNSVLNQLSRTLESIPVHQESIEKVWPRYCFLTGRYVTIQTPSGIEEGECLGIDERGAVILRNANGHWQTILSGEVIRY